MLKEIFKHKKKYSRWTYRYKWKNEGIVNTRNGNYIDYMIVYGENPMESTKKTKQKKKTVTRTKKWVEDFRIQDQCTQICDISIY